MILLTKKLMYLIPALVNLLKMSNAGLLMFWIYVQFRMHKLFLDNHLFKQSKHYKQFFWKL